MDNIVPTDEMLLKEITRIQDSQSPNLGIQKIWDYIKAEHPCWSFGLKRLREIRKKNGLAPTPLGSCPGLIDLPTESLPTGIGPPPAESPPTEPLPIEHNACTGDIAPPPGMVTLELRIEVAGTGRQSVLFKEFIPAEFCIKGANRDMTSTYLQGIIDVREAELIQMNDWPCLYCGKRAVATYGMPVAVLTATPPTVFNLTQPLCSVGQTSRCVREAFGRMQSGIAAPGFLGKGTQVYNFPA